MTWRIKVSDTSQIQRGDIFTNGENSFKVLKVFKDTPWRRFFNSLGLARAINQIKIKYDSIPTRKVEGTR